MAVHPFFETQLDHVPALVLYQLVALNYGEFADQLGAPVPTDILGNPLEHEHAGGGCGGGGACSCGGN